MRSFPDGWSHTWPAAVFLTAVAWGGMVAAQDEQPRQPIDGSEFRRVEMRLLMGRSIGGMRGGLESLLLLQIDEVESDCELTAAEKRKLELAGRGDIDRYIEQIASALERLRRARNRAELRQLEADEFAPLQRRYHAGLFGDGSIFAKTVRKTLAGERAAQHARNTAERHAERYRLRIGSTLDTVDRAAKFSPEQRERLIDLLCRETAPPCRFGEHDLHYVLFQASRVPKSKFTTIVDHEQWLVLSTYFDRLRQYEPYLKNLGYLPETEARVP